MNHRSVSLAFPLAAALSWSASAALVQVSPPSELSNLDGPQINDTQREIEEIFKLPYDGSPFEEARQLDDLVERLTTGVDTRVRDDRGTVSVFVTIPDLPRLALEFSVDKRCVHLTYARQEPPGTPHEWRFYQPHVLCVPVPEHADYATAQVAQQDETFSVMFKRKD